MDTQEGTTLYHTKNIDLAAALMAQGVRLVDVVTQDGIVCWFLFEKHYRIDEMQFLTSDAAEMWQRFELMVPARMLTNNLRDLRVRIRKATDEYKKQAHAALALDRGA